jgi:hypothetical protein
MQEKKRQIQNKHKLINSTGIFELRDIFTTVTYFDTTQRNKMAHRSNICPILSNSLLQIRFNKLSIKR